MSLLATRKILAEDGPLLVLIGLIIVVGWTVAHLAGFGERFSIFIYPETAVLLAGVLCATGLLLYGFYTMVAVRPAFPIRYIAKGLATWLARVGLVRLAVLIIAFTLFLSVVSSLKTLIPAFQPYHWDPLLARVDAALYGGVAPWRWLQPVLGRPWITHAINFTYNVWFFIMIGGLLWQLVDIRHPRRRERFLLMFVLIWVVNGLILATVFSSVGPCFYGRLLPGQLDPYAGLMTYLRHANVSHAIWAVSTQDHLWALYKKSALGIGSGISAMPSMHISMAWLLFLFSRQVHRLAGWLMLVYALVIMVGSVHLGWHYSVDGYVSILTTSLLWIAVSAWCRRSEKRSDQAHLAGETDG